MKKECASELLSSRLQVINGTKNDVFVLSCRREASCAIRKLIEDAPPITVPWDEPLLAKDLKTKKEEFLANNCPLWIRNRAKMGK